VPDKGVSSLNFVVQIDGRTFKTGGWDNGEDFLVSVSVAGGDQAMNVAPGGIDLNAQKMDLDVSKEGAGAALTIDPAMAEEFRRGDFSGVVPIILKITPISGPAAVLGMEQGGAEGADV
jgi:hypothetical protein